MVNLLPFASATEALRLPTAALIVNCSLAREGQLSSAPTDEMSTSTAYRASASKQRPSNSNKWFGFSSSTKPTDNSLRNSLQHRERLSFGGRDAVSSGSQRRSLSPAGRDRPQPRDSKRESTSLSLRNSLLSFQRLLQAFNYLAPTEPQQERPVTDYYREATTLTLQQETERYNKQIAEREGVFDRVQEMMDVDERGGDQAKIQAQVAARKFDLSREEVARVEAALHGRRGDEVLIDKFNIEMTRKNIMCLSDRQWLNDEVINFYMAMLMERDERLSAGQPGRLTSHFFNSFFVAKLLEQERYTYSNVRRWTKKFDITTKDKIFCPVNVHNTHWTMAVVYVQKKEIHYYDSMSGSGHEYLQALKRWVADDVKDKKGVELDTSSWKLISHPPDVPQQRNGFDCGVFTITFADYLADDLPLLFSQQDISTNRQRFALSILKGSLPY